MNALVGHLATLLALLLAGVGAAAAFVGGRRGDARYITGAQRAGIAVFVLVALAFLIMERALITHDFSVSYVAQVGSRETPLFYTVISRWLVCPRSWARPHFNPRARHSVPFCFVGSPDACLNR